MICLLSERGGTESQEQDEKKERKRTRERDSEGDGAKQGERREQIVIPPRVEQMGGFIQELQKWL